MDSITRDDGYLLSTDPARIDLDRVHGWLSTDAYWAKGRSRATIARSIEASTVFGIYRPQDGRQVAFARAVTDSATFAWLCDVYVDPAERGRGLGTWLAVATKAHFQETGVPRVLLATWDAHGVYAKAGYAPLAVPERWMELDLRR